MGVEIVKAATVYGKRLSGNAYKVLVAMSLSALDKPSNGRPASLYWGGWDALAIALGHDDARRDGQGHKAVKRAVKELRDGNHITPMVSASRGTRQSYMVHPGGLGKGAQDGPVKGAQSDPVKGAQSGPQSGPKMGPPRKEQGLGGLTQDIDLIRRPSPQEAAIEAAKDEIRPHKFNGTPSDDCLDCDGAYTDRRRHPLRLLRGETA